MVLHDVRISTLPMPIAAHCGNVGEFTPPPLLTWNATLLEVEGW
jgi:hypothetical protein